MATENVKLQSTKKVKARFDSNFHTTTVLLQALNCRAPACRSGCGSRQRAELPPLSPLETGLLEPTAGRDRGTKPTLFSRRPGLEVGADGTQDTATLLLLPTPIVSSTLAHTAFMSTLRFRHRRGGGPHLVWGLFAKEHSAFHRDSYTFTEPQLSVPSTKTPLFSAFPHLSSLSSHRPPFQNRLPPFHALPHWTHLVFLFCPSRRIRPTFEGQLENPQLAEAVLTPLWGGYCPL